MTYRLDIDGAEVGREDEIHALVALIPGVPDGYGRNLDALWDTLMGLITTPLDVRITDPDALRRTLGRERYDGLIGVFRDAATETSKRDNGPVVTFEIAR